MEEKKKGKVNKTDKKVKVKITSDTTPKTKNQKQYYVIKLLIILFLLFGFYHVNNKFTNTISLLAVSEDSQGNIGEGSIINLTLSIIPGTGKTFVNLDTINEVDTQISIINSQKVACELFSLDCENYDFYYNFKGSALVLKGPSASSAIAILTAKTLMKEKIDSNVVITGGLNSGGIMGNVGGVNEKILAAQKNGFKKVIIPIFSDYNESINYDIKVVKAIDIIEAYNEFRGKKFEMPHSQLDKKGYSQAMEKLSELMCEKSLALRKEIDVNSIEKNSTLESYKNQAEKSINSSQIAFENGNYYSQGSFCYNANLNYRMLLEMQKNVSLEQREKLIEKLKQDIKVDYIILNSQGYQSNLKTINDFYVYLILLDRIEEAKEFLDQADKIGLNYVKLNDTITNHSIIINNDSGNYSLKLELENSSTISSDKIKRQKEILYSYAIERAYTVKLWEQLINHTGKPIAFDNEKIDEVCRTINKEISIKSELLKNYGVTLFNDEISKQNMFTLGTSNKYLCIYKGLELNGRINTILNAVGINEDNQINYTQKIMDIAKSRFGMNSNGDFPLIPYIYLEYSEDLFRQDDFSSAMLYSNFALSYGDLDLYLERKDIKVSYFNMNMTELFELDSISLLFIVSLLVILAFL